MLVVGNFVFGNELQELAKWFAEKYPQTTNSIQPQPRLRFKLREMDAKLGQEGTLSWGNGELSIEAKLVVPPQALADPVVIEKSREYFLPDLKDRIEKNMTRWGIAKAPQIENVTPVTEQKANG